MKNKKISGIYKITCRPTNKIYIGQSIDVYDRLFRQHRTQLRNNSHDNSHLQNAFNKYGEENFEFELIKACKIMYLDRFEKLYIRIYDALNKDKGFNFQSGGSSNYYTPELPLEQKFAMSSAKNKSGYYSVYMKTRQTIQGYVWVYQYRKNGKVKELSSVNLLKLEEKVKENGLIWKVMDKKSASASQKLNRFNISKHYLRKYDTSKIYSAAKISRFVDIDFDELYKKAKAGKSPMELAEEYDTTNNTIIYKLTSIMTEDEYKEYKYQNKLNISKGFKNPNFNDNYDEEKILQLAKDGYSMGKIAEMISNDDFKASKKTISRRLKKLMNEEEYKEYVHIVRSKAHSGENHPMFGADKSGENNPFYGKKHTEESKRKMSESKKGKKISGENNSMYGESRFGKDNPMWGKNHSNESKMKMSKNKNTSGYFHVSKIHEKKPGRTYYQYYYKDKNNKRKTIKRNSIEKLEIEVKNRGLEWIKLN